MGMSLMSTCSTNCNVEAPNPDPSNWELIKQQEFVNAVVLKVKYHNCTNFEGNKILVFKKPFELKLNEPLDPHFAEEGDLLLARFTPTIYGWQTATWIASLV
jgi:hypothetical protein